MKFTVIYFMDFGAIHHVLGVIANGITCIYLQSMPPRFGGVMIFTKHGLLDVALGTG